jgi:signal transduction histidine kinase/ActR/RegA family two-component response regulator
VSSNHSKITAVVAALACAAVAIAGPTGEAVCGYPSSVAAVAGPAGAASPWDFFTNFGRYVPRTHCMVDESGRPDWAWIGVVLVLTLGVVAGYLKIAKMWLSCYFAEEKRDRNRSLLDLVAIFALCAWCGYVMNVLMFAWPAYRLSVFTLAVLNVFTWRFALKPQEFRAAFTAGRVQRELAEQLRKQNEGLEQIVAARTEELARAKTEADAASAYKSQFVANISHELRTPLTAILGFTHLLGDKALSEQERAEHLASVARNGEHLLTIINDVLDLSKIEADQMRLEKVEFPVSVLLNDVVGLLKNKASDKGVLLRGAFATAVPRRMCGDPTRVRQVLINLVGNAVKFTDKGEVRIEVSFDAATRQVAFTVIDSGIGMSSDQLTNLFQRFAQGDATTTRRFGGTGLGLSICKRLCEMMGGTVTVESEEHVGSRFTARLPVGIDNVEMIDAPVEERTVRAAVGGAPALGPARVLLVEDGIDNQRLIGLYLRRAGLTVTVAENGREGFERVRAAGERGEPFDLVLMDMQMPVMNGQEATRAIRFHGHKVPIAALTANSMGGDRDAFLAAGCDEYLSKPIDVPAFYAAVERLLKAGRVRLAA